MVNAYFSSGDVNEDGTMTWDEFNNWLDTTEVDYYGQVMGEKEKEASKTFFKFFDQKLGNADYMLSKEEALNGVSILADKVGYFQDEFNYYWHFFNVDDDQCIMINEVKEVIDKAYDVTDEEISNFWIKYYWEHHQVTEYYWWWYKESNGGFNWDGYWNHVPDGPAFDGKAWLFYDQVGDVMPAYMWYIRNQCYFSLMTVGNGDKTQSGTCDIKGHKTIQNDYSITDIAWQFASSTEFSSKFLYQADDWGPVEYMTSDRYYCENNDYWLWQQPDMWCDVCDT